MRTGRAIRFLGTVAAATVVTGLAFTTAETWAGLYLHTKGSMAAAAAAALGLPWLLNKLLTRSYRRIDRGASEWNSFFGMALATHLVALPALYFGAGGVTGQVATREALRLASVKTGLLHDIDEATLEAFPMSEVDTGVTWVPNIGSKKRPRIIVRTAAGDLRAKHLPPAGEVYRDSSKDFIVGPSETAAARVMLCPIPGTGKGEAASRGHNRTVRVPFDGGVVTFRMRAGSHSMSVSAR